MIFSDHALLRFVQRVIGIRDEEQAVNFLEENKYEVYYKLLKLINESEVLYKHFSPSGNGETYNYFLNGDFLIVVTAHRNVVVTLYDIKIDDNKKDNSEKIREYAKKIRRNRSDILKKNARKEENDKESRGLEYLIEYKEKELKELKNQLKETIGVSKKIASETKQLRHKNREMMEKIMFGFKKLMNK